MSRHHERACTDRQAERQPCSQQRWQRRARAYVVRERTRSSSEKALWSCYTVLLLYTRRSWGSPDRFPAAHQHQKRQQPRLCAARMAAETVKQRRALGKGARRSSRQGFRSGGHGPIPLLPSLGRPFPLMLHRCFPLVLLAGAQRALVLLL